MRKFRHLIWIAALTVYHSHGYSFFIDTWVMLDLAAKSDVAKAAKVIVTIVK